MDTLNQKVRAEITACTVEVIALSFHQVSQFSLLFFPLLPFSSSSYLPPPSLLPPSSLLPISRPPDATTG